jgi:glycosyltransferase involved in cell wall biosynthesis
MNVCIVLVTHNRLDYTRKSIARLLQDQNEQFELYLWDNASTDGTPDYLKNHVKDPRIVEVVLSKENVGQTGAMNYAWSKTKTELVGKVDNDCLVTPGWTRIFAQTHMDIERLGALACWHYPLDEFDEDAARKAGKIQRFGQHELLRHPSVCGSGFIMKRRTYIQYGPWAAGCNVATTSYFMKMARGGEINGWYYPLVLQEHMDDPRSQHSLTRDDKSLLELYPFTFTVRNDRIKTMEHRWVKRKQILHILNNEPWEVKYYVGWRGKLRRAIYYIREIKREIV